MGGTLPEGYDELALRVCLDDIERLTRFERADVRPGEGEAELLLIDVAQRIDIATAVRRRTAAGKVEGRGPRVGGQGEFERMIAEEAEAAREGTGLAAAVEAHARAKPFGGLQEKWSLGDHAKAIYFDRTCESCRGRGQVQCNLCQGEGTIACSSCGGRRIMTCSPCSGSGGTATTTHRPDGSTEYREDRCIWCHGSGQRNCEYCTTGRTTCYPCGGRGEIDCGTCGRSGCLTDIATIGLEASATMELAAILPTGHRAVDIIRNRLGLAALGSVASAQRSEWTARPGAVTGSTEFEVPSCSLEIVMGQSRFRPLALGSQPAIWDYDGAIEYLLEADLAALEEAMSSFKVFDRGGDAAGQAAVRAYCESEANQALLEAAGGRDDAERTVERVKGTISVGYVERSIAAASAFVARMSRREMGICVAIGTLAAAVAGAGLALAWWTTAPEKLAANWPLLAVVVPLGWLIGLGVAWWRTRRMLRALGGPPLVAFSRRKGLGLIGRLLFR